MSKAHYLIYTAVTTWNEPPRARHQVANELKKDGIVYFVEKNKTGTPRVEITKVEENVYVITPYYWLLYKVRYRTPFINEQYHRWLLSNIRDLGINFDIVITFDYTAPAIHNYFNNVVFYCADDNVGFGNFNPWFINRYHSRTEQLVAKGARICVVTSAYMREKISRFNACTFEVPLGAPLVTAEVSSQQPGKNARPVLGLVGYLDSNLHYSLIEELLTEFEIIFIGPASGKNRKRLSRFPNAKLVGPKTGKELYDCLRQVDVCIAPYDPDKLNKGATPNKMWLYLALGKPAVITTMPNIRHWLFDDQLIYICENQDFLQNCWKAYRDNSPELAIKRMEFATQNSWAARINKIKELYHGNTPDQPEKSSLSLAAGGSKPRGEKGKTAALF